MSTKPSLESVVDVIISILGKVNPLAPPASDPAGEPIFPPVAVIITNSPVITGSEVILDGNNSTGSGTLSYQWIQTAGTPLVINDANSPLTGVTGAVVGAYTFQLTVTNEASQTSIAHATVYVEAVVPPLVGCQVAWETSYSVPDGNTASGSFSGKTYTWLSAMSQPRPETLIQTGFDLFPYDNSTTPIAGEIGITYCWSNNTPWRFSISRIL